MNQRGDRKMDFEEFKERAVSEIGEMMEDGQAGLCGIKRNNGITLTGLTPASQGAWIAPVIALEGHYDKLCQGMDFEQVIWEIWLEYLENKEGPGIDISSFVKWEQAKEHVAVKLVNYGANAGLLEGIPHKRFLDLAEVYYHAMPTDGQDLATILINNQHMKLWGIGLEELAGHAYANTRQHFPSEIRNLEELLRGFLGMELPDMEAGIPMYVVSNRQNQYGACAMLFPETFQGLAEKYGTDLYILPSSIHELIAVPAYGEESNNLAGIVKEVNRSVVLPEDKLSDTVYRYCRAEGIIVAA